jgi:hypothetical protein
MSRLWILLFVLAVQACGSALPPDPTAAILHRDLERLVEIAGAEGWTIDRVEIEETLPSALMSVCQTTPEVRTQLLTWLDTQIAARGGSPREAYEAAGRDLDAIDTLLSLSRIHQLLSRSIESADTDCPFWLHPRDGFAGRQILDDRWLLSVGGGGKGIFVRQSGFMDLNFGGAGRALVGRAFGRHATLLTGLEIGGSAAFPKNQDGERGEVQIAADLVTPLVYRHRLVNSYWEVEAGYVGHVVEGESEVAHGARLGVAIGAQSSRRRWLFPGAAFGISYERIETDDVLHFVKLGFRVAIDIARQK